MAQAKQTAVPPKRVHLIGKVSTRPGITDFTKDQYMKNCYAEIIKAKRFGIQAGADGKTVSEGPGEHLYYAAKRPGFSDKHDTSDASAGRGIYVWKSNIYSVIGDKIYKGASEITGVGNRLAGTTGRVQFAEFIEAADVGSADLLIVKAANELWHIQTDDTVTKFVDANIPATLADGMTVMDRYVFIMDPNGRVYHSDVNDVDNWTAANNLDSKYQPDDGIFITRWKTYIAVFCEYSIEMFYNNANASGSVLNVAGGSALDVGCASSGTVWVGEDRMVWVGRTRNGSVGVYQWSADGTLERLSTDPIDRMLEQEGTSLSSAYGYGITIGGHRFYILTLPTTIQKTIVFDLEEQMWGEWSSDVSGTESYFTCVDHASSEGLQYLLDEDNGKVYEMDFDKYQDSGESIKVEIVTNPIDFGYNGNKFWHRAILLGDEQTSTSTVTVDWTDDDYQNYSTSRTLDMSDTHPTLYNLGMSAKRAFRLKHTANTPLRLSAFEFHVSGGGYSGGNI